MVMLEVTISNQVEGKPALGVQLIFCPNWPHLRCFFFTFFLCFFTPHRSNCLLNHFVGIAEIIIILFQCSCVQLCPSCRLPHQVRVIVVAAKNTPSPPSSLIFARNHHRHHCHQQDVCQESRWYFQTRPPRKANCSDRQLRSHWGGDFRCSLQLGAIITIMITIINYDDHCRDTLKLWGENKYDYTDTYLRFVKWTWRRMLTCFTGSNASTSVGLEFG